MKGITTCGAGAALALLLATSAPARTPAAVTPPAAATAREQAHARAVSIVRDDFGIAHIHGKTDADAVFGMIYAQAEDDFPRIENNYLVALGRTAEAGGEAAVWQDLRQRLFLDLDALKDDYRGSPEWLRKLMDAWADGLNYYLATHPETHPRRLTHFEPWMALAFSEGSIGGDIERGVDLKALEAFYGGDHSPAPPRSLADAGKLVEPQGSNGIAIGTSRSADGHPLLWINPHTSFFFRAEQQVSSDEGLDAYGASTWGQFFVYQGFNRNLGWMHTSSGVDNIDEFAVEVAKRDGKLVYRYGKEWRPIREREVTLSVRRPDGSMGERSFTVLATHHGPIIRAEDGRWVAVAMLNNPRPALEQSFLRTKARSIAEYLKISDRKANSSNNTIMASRDGTIAYLHPQFVPIRDPRFDYTRPVDGSDPATDWKGLTPLSDLPQVVGKDVEWVVNTNNWPWSAAGTDSPKAGDFPAYMDQFGENPRGRHAVALLSGDDKFTAQSLTKAAFDSLLTLFAAQLPRLQAGYDALSAKDPLHDRLAGPMRMLAEWDRRWSKTSQPTSLAVYWGEALWRSEGPKAKAAQVPIFTYLDQQTTDAARVAALADAVDRIEKDWGSWQVAWGRMNRFQRLTGAIDADFDDAKPSVPVGFTSGNFGSLAAFGVERHPGNRCFYGTFGNSFVAVVDFGPQVKAWAVSAGGESGDPDSPHFDDQVNRYIDGNLRRVPFADAELERFAARRYHPGDDRPEPHRRKVPAGGSRCGEP